MIFTFGLTAAFQPAEYVAAAANMSIISFTHH